jgi:hypothetical protein
VKLPAQPYTQKKEVVRMAVGLVMGIENECSAEKNSHKFTALCFQDKFFYPDFFCRMGIKKDCLVHPKQSLASIPYASWRCVQFLACFCVIKSSLVNTAVSAVSIWLL